MTRRNKKTRVAPLVYLDYAATTPVDQRVLKKMTPYFTEQFANPASLHQPGRDTKVALERARSQIATRIGATSREIIFTSSATESNNLALQGIAHAYQKHGNHIIVSAVEHASVLEVARALEGQGFRITVLPVNQNGEVSPDAVAAALRPETLIVSVMHANNEIGTIQPIREIAVVVQRARGRHRATEINARRTLRDQSFVTSDRARVPPFFHSDAVQTLGRLPISVHDLGVDLLTCSSHKIYGPKGAALLYVRSGIELQPLLHGGGQEEGRRSSTLNVPAIVGFAEAMALAERSQERETRLISTLSSRLIERLKYAVPGIKLSGADVTRIPHILNVRVPDIAGEAVLFALERDGFAVSLASGCSALKLEPSHVLLACGLSREHALESVRISLGRQTRTRDVDAFVKAYQASVEKIRTLQMSAPQGGRNPRL